jgi:ribose transport system permease protein
MSVSAPSPALRRGFSSREAALQLGLRLVQLGPLVILIVLALVMALASPFFLTGRNLQNLAAQTSILGVLALGQLCVILTRGIDLSVGAVVALSSVLGATVAGLSWGGSPAVVIAVTILAGAVVGVFNGVVYVYGRVPHPFIVTLASLSIVRGLALLISDGETVITVPGFIVSIGNDLAGPIPIAALIGLVLAAAMALLLGKTVWGRWIYAIGGDPEGAKRAGIPVRKVLVSAYIVCGLTAGVAGLLTLGRTSAGAPTGGQLLELDAITAVIIGGASFFGGRGHVHNVIVGALILGVIRNGLNLLDVDPFWQLVAIGAVILVSIEMDVLRGWLEQRFRTAQALSAGDPR